MPRWVYYASAERGALIMAGYTASDLCPDCGHPGYDRHDMRTASWPCLDCACGHEDDRDWRLDRWLEAIYGARLHMFAVARRPNLGPGDTRRLIRMHARWRELYHREVIP